MNDVEKNNATSVPADGFQHLDRVELEQAISLVVGRRHSDLRSLIDEVASTVAEVDATMCQGDADWRALRDDWDEFTVQLGRHLSNEKRDLLPYATGRLVPPTLQEIRRIRDEHNRLLEELDAITKVLEKLKAGKFYQETSSAKLARVIDRFIDLESALNAEIFDEEVGLLRRCADLRKKPEA